MQEIIQLKVSLAHSKPLIWRQILVTKDTTFFELHHIIQIVMGWDNYHMFEFNLEGYRIGEVDEEEKSIGYGNDQVLDSRTIKLSDIITHQKDIINYLYDFGDDWKHQIKVEKFHHIDNSVKYPTCIDGQMNCPPEDCGGIGSFYYFIEVLKDKMHPDHKEIAQWFNKKYDFEKFDKEKVNRKLKGLSKYIRKWIGGD
jgi:Plasmid pRiA4b ORF-3-like protein